MKVILTKDVGGLGEASKVIEVSNGYARNYLIPKGLALLATPEMMKIYEEKRKAEEKKLAKEKEKMVAVVQKLKELEIAIKVDVGEAGRLYGAVTSTDIAEAIKSEAGIEIDKRKIELDEPIKVIGTYEIPVQLLADIEAKVRIRVEAK